MATAVVHPQTTRNIAASLPFASTSFSHNSASKQLLQTPGPKRSASGHPRVAPNESVQAARSCAQIGHCTFQGWKPDQPNWVNQDCHVKVPLPNGLLVGVFDGHGVNGHHISHHVKDIFTNLAPALASATDIHAALKHAFALCQAQIEIDGASMDSGTTATLAVINYDQQTVSLAHVGDSTALLIRPDGGIAYQTQDHKPDAEGESQRLRALGAHISKGRLISGNGSLALARSIGDAKFNPQGKTADPDVICGLPFRQGYSLMLASDGVWDMVSKDVVGSTIARMNPQEAAEFIVNVASSSWTQYPYRDDITGLIAKYSSPELPTEVQIQPSELQIGSYTQQGQKPGNPGWENQDCHLEMKLNDGKLLAAVFDGHGSKGRQLSRRIKDIFACLAPSIASASDTSAAFREAFARCQAQVELDGHCDESGATATVALVDSKRETVSLAHVGDSTALMISPDGNVSFRTRDHKPDAAGELPRLQSHGARICNGRICLDSGSFALARSIGDSWCKGHGVTAEPEVVCGLPFKPGCSVMLASDGVWDMVSKDVVASAVAHARPQEAAESIVNAACLRWSATSYMDDITALIIKSSSPNWQMAA